MSAVLRLWIPPDDQELIDDICVAVVRRRRNKPLPTVLTETEAATLEEWCYAQPGIVRTAHKRRTAELDVILMQLGLLMGLRISEWSNLDIEHIDLPGAQLLIRHGKGDKDRYVPIPEKARSTLAAWIGERRTGPLILYKGRRVCGRTLFYRIERMGRMAGLSKHVHPHMLRHSFASRLYARTKDLRLVQIILGHAHLNTTEVYLHLDMSTFRQAINLL